MHSKASLQGSADTGILLKIESPADPLGKSDVVYRANLVGTVEQGRYVLALEPESEVDGNG